MTDREKVIRGLECCVLRNPEDRPRCDECPYDGACLNRLKHDALALLKAQEPRIVTEADFGNADEAGFIPAWCEEKDTDEVYCECIAIGVLEDAKFGHTRWWTSRPTNAQREATPWM